MSGLGFLRKSHQATKAHLARPAKKTTKVCKVGPAKKVEKVRKARLATKAKKTSKVSLKLGVGQPGARLFFPLATQLWTAAHVTFCNTIMSTSEAIFHSGEVGRPASQDLGQLCAANLHMGHIRASDPPRSGWRR